MAPRGACAKRGCHQLFPQGRGGEDCLETELSNLFWEPQPRLVLKRALSSRNASRNIYRAGDAARHLEHGACVSLFFLNGRTAIKFAVCVVRLTRRRLFQYQSECGNVTPLRSHDVLFRATKRRQRAKRCVTRFCGFGVFARELTKDCDGRL